MSEFLYRVGDEYEGHAVGASRFIKEVMSAGGKVTVIGKRVVITSLPEQDFAEPEPVVEELIVPEEPAIEIDEVHVPKRRGRSRKTEETAEEIEEDSSDELE